MVENEGLDFAALLSAVKKARTDNEKFASLLLVTRFTKADTLSSQNRKELFNTIGPEFLLRLLRTCGNDNTAIFASIGATVLCAFGCDEGIAMMPQVSDATPALLGAIEALQKKGPEAKNAIEDCAECLKVLAVHDAHAEKMIKANGVALLCGLYEIVRKSSYEILVRLLEGRSEMWTNNSLVLEEYIEKLSAKFKTDQGLDKFELCKYLLRVISTIPAGYTISSVRWRQNTMVGLREVLSSNILPEQRIIAFGLASEILRVCSVPAFFTDNTNGNFPLVIVRLACIDSGMLVKKLVSEDTIDPESIALLLSCYSIIEAACSVIAEFEEGINDDILSFEQIKMVQPAMVELVEMIIKFLTKHLTTDDAPAEAELCVGPSIRFLGSWLNVEYNLISDLGKESFQLIPECLKYAMKSDTLDIVKHTLPAVMKAAETEDMNQVVINDIFPLAGAITEYVFQNARQDMEAFHMTLQSFLGILLILKREDISKHRQAIKELFSVVILAAQESMGVETDGHLATLSVIMMNLPKFTPPTDAVSQIRTRKVVSLVLEFVKCCYHTSKDGTKLEVSESVKELWADFAALWTICGRELARLAGRLGWVRRRLREETWAKEQLPLLFNLAKNAEDVGVAETFSSLMEAVAEGQ